MTDMEIKTHGITLQIGRSTEGDVFISVDGAVFYMSPTDAVALGLGLIEIVNGEEE